MTEATKYSKIEIQKYSIYNHREEQNSLHTHTALLQPDTEENADFHDASVTSAHHYLSLPDI